MKWSDRLNKLNKREKTLLFAVAVLVFIWVAYSLIVEPFYNRWVGLNKDIRISKIVLKKGIKIFKQKEYVTGEYDKYLARFTAKESNEEEMALILNEIERQARKSFVRIVNMKPRRVVKSNFYRIFYVDLDTEASMRNILKFIKSLKDSKLSLHVEQLTLNSRAKDPSILVGKMTVSRLGLD